MKPECAQAIQTAAGRKLTKNEYGAIEDRVHSSLRELAVTDRAGFHGMSTQERMVAAASLAKEKMIQDVVRAQESTIREAGKSAARASEMAAIVPGRNGQVKYLRNKIANIGNSTYATASTFFSLVRGLEDKDGGKLFGMIQDPAQQIDLARAMFGEQASPEAMKVAESVRGMNSAIVKRMNSEGLPIHEREDYVMPQPQDPTLVAKAGREAWIKDTMPRLDRSKYVAPDGTMMNDDAVRHLLEESYRSIATDGANKRAEGGDTHGSPLVGAAKNAPRRLFYKDAQAHMDQMAEFGRSTNMYELQSAHVRSMAKDIAMTETFGRNADANLRQILAQAKENDMMAVSGKDNRQAASELANKVQNVYDTIAHPDRPGGETWMGITARTRANFFAQTRGLMGSTQLGSLVGALPDVAALKMAAEHSGLPQMRVFRNAMDAIVAGSEGKDFLHRIGVWQEGFQHAGQAMLGEEFRNGWGTWLNERTHRIMGLNSLDRGLRAGMGRTVLDMLGEFTRKHDTLASADGEARFLGKGGITEDHWATWRAAEVETGRGNEHLLTPDTIRAIPDAKMDPIAERRVAERSEIFAKEVAKRDAQIERLGDNPDAARVQEIRDAFQAKHDSVLSEERAAMKDEAATKLMEVAAQQMQFGARGASRSSLSDRMAMGMDPKDAGTFKGELWRFMSQFKSVPIGIFRAHLAAMRELDGWGSKASYAARFVGYSTLMGAMATEIKAMINGQNPRNMNIATDEGKKFWMESLAAGGGFGIYGDLFANDRTKFGSGAEVLAGPGITAAYGAVKEFSKAREDAFNGESKHSYALAALRLVRQNATPFANVWYAKAAFNRLVYDQLQDQLSPGHSAQQQRRMQSRGASYWWAPGTTSPQSAPDLSQGYQDR